MSELKTFFNISLVRYLPTSEMRHGTNGTVDACAQRSRKVFVQFMFVEVIARLILHQWPCVSWNFSKWKSVLLLMKFQSKRDHSWDPWLR